MRYIVLIFKKESEESSELDFYYKIGDDDNHNPRYYNSSKFSVEYPSDAVEAYDDWIEEYNALLGTTDRNGIKDKKKKVRSLFGNSNTKLNEWFSRIKIESQTLQQIIENELEKTSKLRLIIETKQEELQKLFWHQLEILKNEHKQKVGVVFTIPDLHPKTISPTNTNNQSTLKILIIFGVNQILLLKSLLSKLKNLPKSTTACLVWLLKMIIISFILLVMGLLHPLSGLKMEQRLSYVSIQSQ